MLSSRADWCSGSCFTALNCRWEYSLSDPPHPTGVSPPSGPGWEDSEAGMTTRLRAYSPNASAQKASEGYLSCWWSHNALEGATVLSTLLVQECSSSCSWLQNSLSNTVGSRMHLVTLLAPKHSCIVFGASTELSRLMSIAYWAYMELAASPGCTASSSYQLFHILPHCDGAHIIGYT